MAPPSGFPSFRDGDVKLVITDELTYMLHSAALRHRSSTLAHLLDDNLPRQMLILVDNTGPERIGVNIQCVFERVPLDSNGRPVGDSPTGIGSYLSDDNEVVPLFTAFDAVLRALYGLPLDIGNAQTDDLTSLLSSAFDITLVAEYLDCAHIVTQAIESKLLATGQKFYSAVKMNPANWLDFGNRIRSKAIFKEALIHAAGQFSFPFMQAKLDEGVLPDDAYAILQQKAELIKKGVKQAESHLATYYPQRIMRRRPLVTDKRDNISVASYSNDILVWIPLSLFRHFLADQMAHDRTHNAPDQGYSFIKAIDKGGEAYLPSAEVDNGFHNRFPMSSKASACLKQRLTEIKQSLKQWTTPLLQENSQLDLSNTSITYFTNTIVTENDYPWHIGVQHSDSEDDMADDGDANTSIENDETEEDDMENDNVGGLDGVMDDFDGFDQLETGETFDRDMADLDDIDGVPMSDIDETEEETAARHAKEKADYKAAKSLLRLNPLRPVSPASNCSGDTEEMDPRVYQDYLNEQQMKQDLARDTERIADMCRKRKAAEVGP